MCGCASHRIELSVDHVWPRLLPDVESRTIPIKPMAAAAPDSMTSSNRSVEAATTTSIPRPNLILFTFLNTESS